MVPTSNHYLLCHESDKRMLEKSEHTNIADLQFVSNFQLLRIVYVQGRLILPDNFKIKIRLVL